MVRILSGHFFFVAYLSAHTVLTGTDYLAVFRVVGTAAFLVYGLGPLANAIWKGMPWGFVTLEAIDGLVYALLTAGSVSAGSGRTKQKS